MKRRFVRPGRSGGEEERDPSAESGPAPAPAPIPARAPIPVPGHTRGSIALLHRDVLFTGDHLWANDAEDGLECGADVCWYSWRDQRHSVERLVDHAFTWVLPGHGRRWHAPDAAAMRAELRRVAATMGTR